MELPAGNSAVSGTVTATVTAPSSLPSMVSEVTLASVSPLAATSMVVPSLGNDTFHTTLAPLPLSATVTVVSLDCFPGAEAVRV
jgi:hypothetical protein